MLLVTRMIDALSKGARSDRPFSKLALGFALALTTVCPTVPADAPLGGRVHPAVRDGGPPPEIAREAIALWLPEPSALYADEAGTVPAFVEQTVRRMADASGNNHPLTSPVGLVWEPDGSLRSWGIGAAGTGWLGCDDPPVVDALQGSHTGYFVGRIDFSDSGLHALAAAGKRSGGAQLVLRGDLGTPRVTRTGTSSGTGAATELEVAAIVGEFRSYAWTYDAGTRRLTLYRDGELMVSSVLKSGAGKCPIDSFTILGQRQNGAFQRGVAGRFSAGAVFSGAHTDQQVREMSAYLSSFSSAPVAEPGTVYVDAKEKRSTNGGRFPDEPFSRMDQARQRGVTRILVKSARDLLLWDTNPSVSGNLLSEGPVTIEPYPGQETFLWDVGVRPKGWTRVEGTDVWRGEYPAGRVDPVRSAMYGVTAKIATGVIATKRMALKRTKNPPESPGLNEFGHVERSDGSGFVSVNLGAVDPNGVDVVLGRESSCLIATGPETVTVRKAIGRYGGESNFSAGFRASYPGGNLLCEDCESWWSGRDGGFATRGTYLRADFIRCKDKFATNDGFNIHALRGHVLGMVTMIDCEAFGDADEAIPAHDTNLIYIKGGKFGVCGSGCLTNIQNTTCYVDGALFYKGNQTSLGRRQGGVAAQDPAVVHLKNSVVEDCFSHATYGNVVDEGGNVFSNNKFRK